MSSMNFLALAQRAYREAGFTGAGPVSVLNQITRAADVVQWVLDAHEEIQGRRRDWSFDWASSAAAPFTLNANQDTFDANADFGIAGGVREFYRAPLASYAYPTSQGINGRTFLRFVEWEQFRGLNVPVVAGSTPTIFTMRPDGKIVYYPRPTVECKAVHEYVLPRQVMAANADVPRMKSDFHMAIAWKAVMLGCGKTKDFARFDTAEENFTRLYDDMLTECTPAMTTGGPLA